MTDLTPASPSFLPSRPGSGPSAVPALVVAAGEEAAYRFLEFFAAHIRNRNTRAAYYRNVCSFFRWLEARHVHELGAIRSHHVAAYVEQMTRTHAAPTAKQHLAAIRMLFDWLIVGQVLSYNPAAATRGPKHVVDTGKTPILPPEDVVRLIESIPTDTISTPAVTRARLFVINRPTRNCANVHSPPSSLLSVAHDGFEIVLASAGPVVDIYLYRVSRMQHVLSEYILLPHVQIGTRCIKFLHYV